MVAVRLIRRLPAWRANGRLGGAGASTMVGTPSGPPTLQGLDQLLRASPPPPDGERLERRIGIPEGFPAELLPHLLQAGPSTVSTSTRTATGIARGFSASDIPLFVLGLRGAGWVRQFSWAMFQDRPTIDLHLCDGSRDAWLLFWPRPDGSSLVRASVTTRPAAPCRGTSTVWSDVSLPLLVLPPNIKAEPGSMGASPEEVHASSRMRTRMTPAELLGRFEPLMTGAGWKQDARGGDAEQTIVRFNTTAAAGAPAAGLLILTSLPGVNEGDAFLILFSSVRK